MIAIEMAKSIDRIVPGTSEKVKELIAYAPLLESVEEDVNDSSPWIDNRLPAMLSTTAKKLAQIHERFYGKA